ncbi:MAG: serine/threonine protein kinase [Anaerolineales bacterium]
MDTLQPGQALGAYKIIEKIGAGGMATVYKAYQPSMERYVAIKVLPKDLAEDEEFVIRFQREARTIAKLEHPHILPVFDYGEENGIAYFVMRYLDTGTLRDKLQTSALTLDDIDRIFTQLTNALGYAHKQGVIHRDLKPANILIDKNNNLFLTDFGIAKLLENTASARLTQSNAILGTPAYISPEQAAALDVDQRSDIYSLGIILYELITGRVPFNADTALAIALQHIQAPITPPSKITPNIPPAVEQVILKALDKSPDNRFPNTSAFLDAWKMALKNKTINLFEADTGKMPASQPDGKLAAQNQAPSALMRFLRFAFGVAAVTALLIYIINSTNLSSTFLNLFSTIASPQAQETPIATAPEDTNIILEDDFSELDGTWGTIQDEDSSVQYDNEALRIQIFKPNRLLYSTPNNTGYENVHLEVTAINNNTDPNTVFGLICHQQLDSQSFYYLAIMPAEQYIIVRIDNGNLGAILTNDGQWGFSETIPQNAPSYRLSADCANGNLKLFVNGQEIASVADTTYTKGKVGVMVSSAANAATTDISFDNFLIANVP